MLTNNKALDMKKTFERKRKIINSIVDPEARSVAEYYAVGHLIDLITKEIEEYEIK